MLTQPTAPKPVAGVVLAAGLGSRLRPLTDLRPKALCPVGGIASIDWAIGALRRVTPDLAVNVHAHREQMESHLAGAGVHVSIEAPEPLGTAGALGRLRDWIARRPVVVHNADAWHRADIAAELLHGWDGERMRLLVVPASPPARADFGPWRFAGVSLLPWACVAHLEAEPSGLYEVLWRDAESDGRLELMAYRGPWFDTGTPSSYLEANLAANGGRSVIGPGADVHPTASVVRSVVWPGATVGEGECLVEKIRAPGGITVDASLAAPDPDEAAT